MIFSETATYMQGIIDRQELSDITETLETRRMAHKHRSPFSLWTVHSHFNHNHSLESQASAYAYTLTSTALFLWSKLIGNTSCGEDNFVNPVTPLSL